MSREQERQVIEAMEGMGYTLARRGKHNIWRHPCGAQCVTAVSPSDHRAVKNALSIAKRLLRQAGVQLC